MASDESNFYFSPYKNIGQRVHTQLNRPNTTGVAKYGVAYWDWTEGNDDDGHRL